MIKIENIKVSGLDAAIRGMRNAKNSWNKADSKSGYANLADYERIFENKVKEVCEVAQSMGPEIEDALKYFNTKDFDCNNFEDYNKMIHDYFKNNAKIDVDLENEVVNYFFLGVNDFKLAKTLANAGTDHGKFLRQISVTMDITAPLFWWKEFDTYKVGTTANSTSTMHTITNTPITLENFSFEMLCPMDKVEEFTCDLVTVVTICENARRNYLKYKGVNETLAQAYWRLLIEILPSGWLQTRTVSLNYAVARNIYNSRRFHKVKEWRVLCEELEKLPYGKYLIVPDRG
jgi:hypothetical protein